MRSGQRPAALLIAPHPDDLAWSAGGLITGMHAAGRVDLIVVTVFDRSRYAPCATVTDADSISAIRASEDVAWATSMGAERTALGLPDSSLRGYDDFTELQSQADPDLVAEISSRLSEVAMRVAPRLLLAPSGIGNHVDHLIVRGAIETLQVRRPTAWYEELPYAAQVPAAPPGAGWLPLTIGVDRYWEEREAAMQLYRSQDPQHVVRTARAYARSVGGGRATAVEPGHTMAERIWVRDPEETASILAAVTAGVESGWTTH